MANEIKRLEIITEVGVKTYRVGGDVDGRIIASIRKGTLRINGDPYDHYLIYDGAGGLLASINSLVPVGVEYLNTSTNG